MSNLAPDLQAVLYDIDGTLYGLSKMRRLMAVELGRSALGAPLRTMREWRMIQAYRRAQEQIRDAPPGTSQLHVAAEALNLEPDALRPVIEHWMEHRPLNILPRCARQPVLEAVDLLGSLGIRQAVYSDYPAHSKVQVFGVAHHFEFHVCSSDPEVGAYKPSPDGFHHAAARWGLEPDQIIYVGDRPEVDGTGARAAGMHFVHVEELSEERVNQARSAPVNSVLSELFDL